MKTSVIGWTQYPESQSLEIHQISWKRHRIFSPESKRILKKKSQQFLPSFLMSCLCLILDDIESVDLDA